MQCKELLVAEDLLQAFVAKAPNAAEVLSVIDLHQYFMALFYFCQVAKLPMPASRSDTLASYFNKGVMKTIEESAIVKGVGHQSSKLQTDIKIKLKKLFSKIQVTEEIFVNTLPQDLHANIPDMKREKFFRANGPWHYRVLIDPNTGMITLILTAKDLFHAALLPPDLPIVDICYKDWETAVTQNKDTEFLRNCIFAVTPLASTVALSITFAYTGLQASMAEADFRLPIEHEMAGSAGEHKAGYKPQIHFKHTS